MKKKKKKKEQKKKEEKSDNLKMKMLLIEYFPKVNNIQGIAMNGSTGIILSNYFFDKKNGIDIKNYFTNKYQICSFIKSNNIFISLISIVKIYDINQINISCINLGLFNFIIE